MTPYDDLPIEVRRANWGWWGEPWPSGVCENEDGSINWEMQREFPAGESCFWCTTKILEGQSGTSMPSHGVDGTTIVFQHKECGLRSVLGSYKHLTSGCTGNGSCNHIDDGLSARDDALLVWEWVQLHGSQT